ncbi:alkaline phosphatase family protein [Candidatus Woesearchaeota archaeon]|nr:alkaline phosphatase family protein [Candidatus Woesearchaeota archaeon]
MPLPDYKNSIVNLMTSIIQSYNQNYKSPYKALQQIPALELKQTTNIVFFVIDGLGYEYLQRYGKKIKDSVLQINCRAKITSVFPSTTAAAITTFNTGAAPQQHALTGWYMYLKELGIVSTILQFTPRIGGVPFSKTNVDPKLIFCEKSIFEKINAAKYIVNGLDIISSDYSIVMTNKAKRYAYKNLNQCCKTIKHIVRNVHNNQNKQKRKFIYAYWPYFDSYCHHYGTTSKITLKHFKRLNMKINALAKQLSGTNTVIIVTADHGLIDTSKERTIFLKDHPKLQETLVMPLTGERRVAYCYVRPNKTKQFEQYVKQKFRKECKLYKSEELVRKGYFGLGLENPRLAERIGDYTLIMKENYIIFDELLGEERSFHIGNHGGTSKEEMFVPLIVIKC